MRNLSISVALVVAGITAGCSFQVGSSKPATPAPGTPGAAPAPAPAPGAAPTGPSVRVGNRVKIPGATPGSPAPAPAPGTPPAGMPILAGTNIFGTGTPDPNGWKGSFFVIPAGTAKMPALATMTPNGALFASSLNVAPQQFSGGFPGIDPARNTDFAIRWEAPLIVTNEADYTFRLASDDGTILSIDGTLIIDNDGNHGPVPKEGPVHLVPGTHAITVDYFQGGGGVALQLFCKKAGGAETVCPTKL